MQWTSLRSMIAAAAILVSLGGASAQAAEFQMTIDNFTFTPVELKVKVGDTITWTNHDDIPHHRGFCRKIPLQDDGHRRQVLVHLHLRG